MDDRGSGCGKNQKDSSIPQERDLIRLLLQHGQEPFNDEESVAEFVILEIEELCEQGKSGIAI